MRSVPMNPVSGEPAIRFPADVKLQRAALVLGGATGALVGSSVWALGRRTLGWYGVALPLLGAVGGALSWSAFERHSLR